MKKPTRDEKRNTRKIDRPVTKRMSPRGKETVRIFFIKNLLF